MLTKGDGNHRNLKPYVFTTDLASKVRSLAQFGLTVPEASDQIFTEIDETLSRMISAAIPDCNVVSFDMAAMAQQMILDATNLDSSSAMSRSTVITTCPEVASFTKGRTIEVNRIMSPTGEMLGLGPRPGFPSIERQIKAIAALGTSVVLVEDGSFSGGTIKFLVNKMQEARITIRAIFIAVAFPDAVRVIKEVYDGELIVASGDKYDPDNLVDWMPDHDFLPFVPNCGRVIGQSIGEELFPVYTYESFSLTVPYLRPYLDSTRFNKWTSLPSDGSKKFSAECLNLAKRLFEYLGKLNGRSLTVGDLQKGYRHVSVPYAIGGKAVAGVDRSLTEVIMSAYNQVFGG